MRKRIDWNWEVLDEQTKRVKVIGGWLIVHTNEKLKCESMVHLPDRDHEYEIMPPIVDTQIERADIAKDFG